MTNEELNTALYKKMFAEQEQFKAHLLTLSPVEALDHAYEYVTREDLLLSLEYNNLTDKQAKAILRSPCPLGDCFKKWESWETNHMQNIWEAIESRANDVLRDDFKKSVREGR